MRIGIVVDKFPSYSETFILNKVEGLCQQANDVVVFRSTKGDDKELEKKIISSNPSLTIVDVHIASSRLQATRQLLLQPSAAFSALKHKDPSLKKRVLAALRDQFFAAHPCDIYHFEFSGLALQYMPLFKQLKGKIVVSCRGSAEKVKPVTDARRRQELVKLFERVDMIHCVSQDMAETISSLGAKASQIFINRPAIKTATFLPAEKKHNNRLQIFSVGRLTFQKGFLIGLLAIKKVVQQCPQVHWTIAGDGPLKPELQFYIHDMQLSEHVTLAGALLHQSIIAAYRETDIYFLPSVYEGIANVVLEAMAMQLPVVSSDCSGMKEVVHHEENGLLAANYDHEAMADNLVRLVQDEQLRNRLGKTARTTILNDFDISRQLDVFEKNYQQLLTTIPA